MKRLLKIYKFAGSVYFAIFLIFSVTCFVIAGTFIESYADSHLYANQFTYESPLFTALLCGFFINILISSLTRYPFKLKHIPFLITHLGLLMILAGTLIKSRYGVQGNMGLIEGSGSDQIFIRNSMELLVESKGEPPLQLSFDPSKKIVATEKELPLTIELLSYSPHSTEKYDSWTKGDRAFVAGLRAMPLREEKDNSPLIHSAKAHVYSQTEEKKGLLWKFYTYRSEESAALAQKIYTEELELHFIDKESEQTIQKVPLKQLIDSPQQITSQLRAKIAPIQFPSPQIELHLTEGNLQFSQTISYNTEKGTTLRETVPSFFSPSCEIELHCSPSICVIDEKTEESEKTVLYAFDEYGRIYRSDYPKDHLQSIMVFDEGFQGYGIQAELPFTELPRDQRTINRVWRDLLEKQLEQSDFSSLAYPLQLIKEECDKHRHNFSEMVINFLICWEKSNKLLYPPQKRLPDDLKELFSTFEWEHLPEDTKKGALWISMLLTSIEHELRLGLSLHNALERQNWPLINVLENKSSEEEVHPFYHLAHLSQQVLAAAPLIPLTKELNTLIKKPLTPEEKAHFFSIMLLSQNIHLKPMLDSNVIEEKQIALFLDSKDEQERYSLQHPRLETPLTLSHKTAPPTNKLEDHRPFARFKVKKGEREEVVKLGFDRFGTGLKWPVLDGEYLLRLQPQFKTIPYRIRLRDARQINYTNSSQAFSYESDLLINDTTEATLSMNKVYETWDGYRFYLANITPPDESQVKHAQIVINLDPVKYRLTYPGGVILSLGIFLLFRRRFR